MDSGTVALPGRTGENAGKDERQKPSDSNARELERAAEAQALDGIRIPD
jgi:hypothetical protein